MLFRELISVALGGAVGAGGRYLAGIFARNLLGADFPWGTFSVNIVGCFFIGVAASLVENREGALWLFLVAGLLGGLTTFSAFGYDTIQLIQRSELIAAALNITLQIVLGLIAVWAGLALAGASGLRIPGR